MAVVWSALQAVKLILSCSPQTVFDCMWLEPAQNNNEILGSG